MNTEERDAAYWKRRYDDKCEELAKLRRQMKQMYDNGVKDGRAEQLIVHSIVEEALK